MTYPDQTPRRLTATTLIDMLQQIVRANYEQAALHQASSDGEVYETVADVVARANPAGWSRYAHELPVSEIADHIGASLLLAERELAEDSPARNAIGLVRRQIPSLR